MKMTDFAKDVENEFTSPFGYTGNVEFRMVSPYFNYEMLSDFSFEAQNKSVSG